jgi:hypothetical protein
MATNDNENSFEDDIEAYGCLQLSIKSHVDDDDVYV